MARLLYQRDSAVFMLNAVRRHQRLCRTHPNGNVFISAIQPHADDLKSKAELHELAVNAAQNAGDDVLLADMDLDNAVRNVFDDCKKFDRSHAGGEVLVKIFKDGTFSGIVRMPYKDEPNEVEKIAVKLESLGTSHQLYPLAAMLHAEVAKVRDNIEAHKIAIRDSGAAAAELEIAKAETVRAYEANYLDARKALGRANAERLFPSLSNANTGDTDTETDPDTPDPTA